LKVFGLNGKLDGQGAMLGDKGRLSDEENLTVFVELAVRLDGGELPDGADFHIGEDFLPVQVLDADPDLRPARSAGTRGLGGFFRLVFHGLSPSLSGVRGKYHISGYKYSLI